MLASLPSRLTRRLCALLLPLACLPFAGKLNAQTPPPPPALVVTHTFNNSASLNEGSQPSDLILGSDGFFYGTAQVGGSFNVGNLFRIRPDGSGFTVLASLGYDNGFPNNLIQGSNGVLYGTSNYGGSSSIFRINTDGTGLATIHTFGSAKSDPEGNTPSGPLVQGSDGYFYGATAFGGTGNAGTLFKISPDGLAFIVIHVFNSSSSNGTIDANGATPSALTLGPNGVLYGTTRNSSLQPAANTVFKINTDGTGFATLYTAYIGSDSNQSSSALPNGPMALGLDGALYGAMSIGGVNGTGSLFKINADGTGFTVLHSFASPSVYTASDINSDGISPQGLSQARDGYFYGTASSGGANATGTVFRVSPNGTVFQVLHTFGPAPTNYPPTNMNRDGAFPEGLLAVGSDGLVYGTAGLGGINNDGTVFRLITSHTHILWNKTDGTASLWSVDTNGAFTFQNYGPYPGWTAAAVASGGDGLTHLLWNHTSDGEIALWTVNGAGFTHQEYGPYPGWAADALAAGPSGLPDVLWNYENAGGFGSLSAGTASLWGVNFDGSFLFQDFGPFPGWTAAALAVGGNSLPSLLWNHSADGEIALSSVAPSAAPGGTATTTLYGPFAGWTATALSAGADSVPHILWNNTSGQTSLWNVNADTTYQHFEYGPYPGWSARSLATGPDNLSHLLWDYTDGTLSLWSADTSTGAFSFQNYGPYPGWTAVALSAGP